MNPSQHGFSIWILLQPLWKGIGCWCIVCKTQHITCIMWVSDKRMTRARTELHNRHFRTRHRSVRFVMTFRHDTRTHDTYQLLSRRFCVGGSTISTRTKSVEVSRKLVETVVLILESFSFRIDRSFEFLEFYADSFTIVEEAVILIITCECSRVVTVSGLIYVKL